MKNAALKSCVLIGLMIALLTFAVNSLYYPSYVTATWDFVKIDLPYKTNDTAKTYNVVYDKNYNTVVTTILIKAEDDLIIKEFNNDYKISKIQNDYYIEITGKTNFNNNLNVYYASSIEIDNPSNKQYTIEFIKSRASNNIQNNNDIKGFTDAILQYLSTPFSEMTLARILISIAVVTSAFIIVWIAYKYIIFYVRKKFEGK